MLTARHCVSVRYQAECGFPPQPFAKAFAIAREAGLACIPHAGELPPGKVQSTANAIKRGESSCIATVVTR